MVDRLDVFLFDRLAGHPQIDSDRPLPLSVSLPLRQQPWQAAVVRNWFGNLLPEGTIREAIAARLRLAVWDDFALLEAIGGECAGAVSIVVEGTVPGSSKLPLERLEQVLLGLGQPRGEGFWAMLGAPQRLSLAGAQDKLAVLRGWVIFNVIIGNADALRDAIQ